MTDFIPHVLIWAVLATVVVFLALFRRRMRLSAGDNDEDGQRPAGRLDVWGRLLTTIAVVYGLALAGAYVYTGIILK